MPYDFPNSPTNGQAVTGATGASYRFDGTKWTATGSSGVSSFNTRVGAVVLSGADVTTALTYTPYNATNPSGYQTAAQVTTAVAPALANVGRNLLHNSMFNVAQRGTGGFVAAGYNLDRWTASTTLDTIGFGQVAIGDAGRTAIGDEAAAFCLSNTFTGNAGATAYNSVIQRIDGVRRLSGKTVTVSFWAQSAAGLKLGVSLDQFFGTGGSPSASVNGTGQATPALSNTWTRHSFTFALAGTAGLTLGTNNDNYTALNLWYSSGANNASRAGGIGVQSGSINLWGVQLKVGSLATPLDYGGSPQQQLAECQRYYQVGNFGWWGYGAGAATIGSTLVFATQMRAAPTITLSGQAYGNASAAAATSTAMSVSIQATVTATGGAVFATNYTASADL